MTVNTEPVPFIDLGAQRQRLGDSIDQAIAQVLEHGQFILGPEVVELERQLAQRSGVGRVVSCSSGTDALLLTLRAWGIGQGDAVIVPAFTFIATAEVVALLGATPVFADVNLDDFQLDPDQIPVAAAAARTAGLEPRAVIAVGLFGQPPDQAAIRSAAAREGLLVLGDAAQSYGATCDGTDTAQFGHATATSFFPSKPLGCYGDGGAIFTDDEDLADVLVSLRMHGHGTDRYEHVRIGTTARLDTIQAAILLAKLTVFDDELEQRNLVARRYESGLSEVAITPAVMAGRTSAWAQYTLRVPDRPGFISDLRDAGIPTAVHYPTPLHRQPAYSGFPKTGDGLPNSERLATEVVSLPMHPYLKPAVSERIIEAAAATLSARPGRGVAST
ncbi:MAG: DegT/DnrJ/EryC1/StrS aminotransferase family protein [Aquihabitans sp.]